MKYILFVTLFFTSLQANDNIEIYSAYGNTHKVIIQGRMLKVKSFKKVEKSDSWFRNFWRRVKGIESDEIANKKIVARFDNVEFSTKSDDEGYFNFDIKSKKPFKSGYKHINLNINNNPNIHKTKAKIFPNKPLVGIISDFDDTIVVSNVTNKIKLGINNFFKNYKQRQLIESMRERFEKILLKNPKSSPNPLFIISGSPSQFFKSIEGFLNYYKFPNHILMLKKIHGNNKDSLFKQFDYKYKKIKRLFQLYPNIKWIMFGDSGEQDFEVYKTLKEKYPNKIIKYYIRDIKSGGIVEY